MYIKTVRPEEATGDIPAIYASDLASMGSIMEATECWSARPDILAPVEHLLHQMRDGFSLGLLNFRLITFVAAKSVPSSYCSHVYFKTHLRDDRARPGVGGATRLPQCTVQPAAGRDAGLCRTDHAGRVQDWAGHNRTATPCRIVRSQHRRHRTGSIVQELHEPLFRRGWATAETSFLDEDPEVRNQLNVGK